MPKKLVVPGREIEHGGDGGRAAHRRTGDGSLAHDQRKLGHPPIVVDHVQVAVTDPTVFHRDLNLVMPERSRIVLEGIEFATGLKCRPCFDHQFLLRPRRSHSLGGRVSFNGATWAP